MDNTEIFLLLDKLVEKDNNLSQEEKTRALLYLEENPEDGGKVFKDWVNTRHEGFEGDTSISEQASQIAFSNFMSIIERDNRRSRLRRLSLRLQKVAAVLLISLSSIGLYEYSKVVFTWEPEDTLSIEIDNAQRLIQKQIATNVVQEYYSPAGSRSKIILEDSTTIWLNSDSRLTVNSNYGDSTRSVVLDGHALLDVRTNENIPFYLFVRDQMAIKVLGTIFSVKAYDDAEFIETVLVEGKIDVMASGQTVEMVPSQKLLINNKENKIYLTTVREKDSYVVWKDGILIFDEAPMREVITSLEKWFNISINVENKAVLNYSITANLDNLSLEQVLDNLSYSSNLQYSINKRIVLLK